MRAHHYELKIPFLKKIWSTLTLIPESIIKKNEIGRKKLS